MFKLIFKQQKEFTIFKFSSLLFLISVFLFASSCESIKKKVQSEPAPASRSLAGLSKSPAGISGTQLNQLKRREREILSKREGKPLKVVYSFLANEKTKRICYVESFKTKDIVPPFAQPASYEEARLLKKPPVPKCSGQEYSMISSYQNASVLADEEGLKLAGLPLPLLLGAGATLGGLGVCGFLSNKMADQGLTWENVTILTYTSLAGAMATLGGIILGLNLGAQVFLAGCGLGLGGTYIYHVILK